MRFGKFKKNQTCHGFSLKLWETCKKSWKSQFWLHNCLCETCGRITIIILFNTFFCTSKTNSGPPFFDMERLVVVNHRWQSKNTDGVSAPSIYLSDCLFD